MVEIQTSTHRIIRLTEAQIREAVLRYIQTNTRGPIPPPSADMDIRYSGATISWEEREKG